MKYGIDARCLELVKSFEDLSLKAYMPTPNDVWTIGYGHTKGVHEGMVCTIEQADAWLAEDLQVAAGIVDSATKNASVRLSASAIAALISFAFNTGTLGPSIKAKLHTGNIYGAWEYMAKWRKQGRNDLRGLARRRAMEMALFMEDPFP